MPRARSICDSCASWRRVTTAIRPRWTTERDSAEMDTPWAWPGAEAEGG
jgi:hypothetical protein